MKDSLFGGEAFNDEALHGLRRRRQAGALATNQAHFATDPRFSELNEPQALISLVAFDEPGRWVLPMRSIDRP
ncbi:hypothetical protein [Cobetia amphilecti]|uniref:hypothetical protein n=1 Tax=Cobetia amphilecti TaxID=1055104 RepID=UPI0036F096F2|nr:hypothetical protein [Cobetia litoralis]